MPSSQDCFYFLAKAHIQLTCDTGVQRCDLLHHSGLTAACDLAAVTPVQVLMVPDVVCNHFGASQETFTLRANMWGREVNLAMICWILKAAVWPKGLTVCNQSLQNTETDLDYRKFEVLSSFLLPCCSSYNLPYMLCVCVTLISVRCVYLYVYICIYLYICI